jgi:hypothetical protein
MWKKLLSSLALAGLVTGAQAETSVSVQAAPPSWRQYAGLVEQQLESRLAGDSEQATRLRTYFQSGANAQLSSIPVQVWVNLKGTVNRVVFPPFLDSQANADLKGVLEGAAIADPPKGILLPIRLNLHVLPTPPSTTPSPLLTPAASTTRS